MTSRSGQSLSVRRWRRAGLAAMALKTILIAALATGLIDLRADPPPRYTVPFSVGTDIALGGRVDVAASALALADRPTTIALVTGHTGPDGDPMRNLELSAARADTVARALEAEGITRDRIRRRGLGDRAPTDRLDGETDSAWAQRQRRAEIRILPRRLAPHALGASGGDNP